MTKFVISFPTSAMVIEAASNYPINNPRAEASKAMKEALVERNGT